MKILVLALYAVIYHCNADSALGGPQLGANRPMDRFIDYVVNSMERDIEDSECKTALQVVVSNLRSNDLERVYHSFEMFDAWGKIPSGLLYGHFLDLGNYGQCINIDFKINSTVTPEQTHIVGQYCHVMFGFTDLVEAEDVEEFIAKEDFQMLLDNMGGEDIGIGLAVCLPKICSKEEIDLILEKALKAPILRLGNCGSKDSKPLETIDYVAICFFSLVGLLLVLSTSYDLITEYMHIKKKEEYLIFSVIANGRKLFAINLKEGPEAIHCIHGIRSLSMMWVIIGHGLIFYVGTPLMNMREIALYHTTTVSFIFYTGVISVDSFLYLSGFLVAWVAMKQMKRANGWLNVPMMYIHRIFRLLPILSILMLFVVSISKFFGEGPMWPLFTFSHKFGCSTTWWRTLLFIQNYGNNFMCMGHSWYLAVDMQLYIFSPLLLIPLYKWGKKFIPVIVLLGALSLGCTYATFSNNNYTSVLMSPEDSMRMRFQKSYIVTHLRYTIWLIGIIFGYIMFKIEGKKIKIPKIYNLLAWTAVIITVFSIVFGPYNSRQAGYRGTVEEAVAYDYFARVAWGISLSWIIFSCRFGYGGVIGSFLSYPVWQIISRLSFCMYLVHLSVLFIIFGNNQSNTYFSNFDAICTFWAAFGLTFSASVVAVICFESPLIALQNIFFRGKKGPSKRKVENDSQLNNESYVKSDSNVKSELSVQKESWEKTEKDSVA